MRITILSVCLFLIGTLNLNAQSDAKIERVVNAETKLMDAASANPQDAKAQYNLAVYYYNQANELLKEEAAGAAPGVEGVNPEIERLFSMAMPSAHMAYNLDSKNLDILKLLSGVYFGTNQMDAWKKTEKEIEALTK
jgi:hypothetical protein